MEKVLVKILKRYSKWSPGEVAGFKPDLAQRIVKAGAGELHDCGFGPGVPHPRDPETRELLPLPGKGKPEAAPVDPPTDPPATAARGGKGGKRGKR